MKSSLIAVLGGASSALAAVKGYNYASNGQDQASFEAQFRTAASLAGATDFTGARLYTMIQDGSMNSVISAIPAAISTKTTLLLGLWASTDQNGFNNELAALKATIDQFGDQVAPLVTGISVGSEDLYRISPTGIANGENPGQAPDVLVNYIGQVRDTIKGTAFANIPVGHVDTWNVYVNGSNANVISACDFLGLDEYPYYQTTDTNTIDNAKSLFFESYDKVAGVSGGKPIWITEAGWPTAGPTTGQAVASVDNAERFCQDVSCELQNRGINTWWYILADNGASPSFGVSENGQPKYNLECTASSTTGDSGSSSAGSSDAAGSGASSTTSDAGSGSGSGAATSSLTSIDAPVISTNTATPSSAASGAAGGSSPSTTAASDAGTTTTSGGPSPSSSTFDGAGAKVENSFAGLVVAAAAFVALAL